MPPGISNPSNNPAMRKSTCKIQKTSKYLHAEPEMDEDELPPIKHVTPAPDNNNIYVNEEEERVSC